jgi:predicted regulator of Ras-like GTPase activity (Roadblock/LC7/MglB family)
VDEFTQRLRELEAERWTGWFRAMSGPDPVGFGQLAGGKVAWALARRQSPGVAALLERLGGVRSAALDHVRATYQQAPRRAFPTALLEADLVPVPVLRRAVLLHLRAALSTLRTSGKLLLDLRGAPTRAEPDLLFSLGEIMPDLVPQEARPAPSSAAAAEEIRALLEPLASLPGLLAAALVDAEGRALAATSRTGRAAPAALAALSASAAEAAARLADFHGLGRPGFLMVGAEHGSLVARWVDGPQPLLLAVLVADESRIGMARVRLNAVAQSLAARTLGSSASAVEPTP